MASYSPTLMGRDHSNSDSDLDAVGQPRVTSSRKSRIIAVALAVAGVLVVALLARQIQRAVRPSASSLAESIIAESEQTRRCESPCELSASEDLWAKAQAMDETAKVAQAKADEVRKDGEDHVKHAKGEAMKAKDEIQAAKDSVTDSKAAIREANQQIKQAKELRKQAKEDAKTGNRSKQEGEAALAKAEDNIEEARKEESVAGDEMEAARAKEESSLQETGDARACVDLPGVRFHNWTPKNEFRRVVDPEEYPEMNSLADCTAWCQKHATCQQAVFSHLGLQEGESPCSLYEERGSLYDFRDDFNASWCGSQDAVDYLVEEVKKVFEQQPWVGENKYGITPCGFGGDDCQESKCCATQQCDWTFKECEYFKCFVKDDNFAGCAAGPDAGWQTDEDGNPVMLGEGVPEDDIPAAGEGQLVHPSSLFCFVVMLPGEHASAGVVQDEGLLVETMQKTNSSIFSCEDQLVIEGYNDGGGSEANIDVFIGYWDQVKEDGRYMLHDWLIKADADCVFMADRVKAHIDKFRPPAGVAVYFRNTDYKFHFMGAFEMMSREGAIIFFENQWQCNEKIGHTGGEDYWMRLCLDALGLRHITDYSLLNDKYAAHDGCGDSWAASFHFYKTPEQYMYCLNEIWNSR